MTNPARTAPTPGRHHTAPPSRAPHTTPLRPEPTCRQWLPAEERHCARPARLYPGGWLCPSHSPAALAGAEEPPTTPMPLRF